MRVLQSLLLSILLTTCAMADSSFRVVTTTPFLQDMAQNIAGSRSRVVCLVPASADLHLYEPSASDVKVLADADLIIVNGLELEGWLDKLISNSGFAGHLVTATKGLESIPEEGGGHDHDHGHSHHHGAADPHAWMQPRNAIRYAENIRDGLIEADPEGKVDYESCADLYVAQLRVLDAWIKREVSRIPSQRRVLVTEHATLGYFAAAYGFETRSLRGVTTRDEPDAQAMAQLIDFLRERQVAVIFAEDGRRPRSLGQLGDELAELRIADLYVGTLQAEGGAADSYIGMMRHNVRSIVRNLQ